MQFPKAAVINSLLTMHLLCTFDQVVYIAFYSNFKTQEKSQSLLMQCYYVYKYIQMLLGGLQLFEIYQQTEESLCKQ
jgi:hypothetical protein